MRLQPNFLLGLLLGGSLPMAAEILYTVTDLGTLGGTSYGIYGTSLNNAGQVAGYSNRAPVRNPLPVAFVYSNGQMTELGTLGGGNSEGHGINNEGQVTGYAETSTGATRAFLYRDGQMTDLGTLGDDSEGFGIMTQDR